jgi:hypothetical protein
MRRRERWEENVTALEAILHDEYPGAIREAMYVLLHESDETFAAATELDYAARRTLSDLRTPQDAPRLGGLSDCRLPRLLL